MLAGEADRQDSALQKVGIYLDFVGLQGSRVNQAILGRVFQLGTDKFLRDQPQVYYWFFNVH